MTLPLSRRRALVLSGGGSKGAYQAGAVRQLEREGALDYEIYVGNSVGALNAGFLAMFGPDEAEAAAAGLSEIWHTIRTRDVRRPHLPLGPFHALTRPSVYDSTPLHRYIRSHVDAGRIATSGRRLCVEAVSLHSGRSRAFTEQSADIVDAIIASAAFPPFLSPVRLREDGELRLHTDGALRNMTPLKPAIAAHATEIDVILLESAHLASFETREPNAIQLAVRALEILMDEVLANDVHTCMDVNEKLALGAAGYSGKRHIPVRLLRPSHPLTFESLDFEPQDLHAAFELGAQDVHDGGLRAPETATEAQDG